MINQDLKRTSCAGFTLTEVSLVILIVGVVLSALWVAVDAVYENSRLTTTSRQVLEIVSRVRSLYGLSRSNMLDMSLQGATGASLLARTGAVPGEMIDSTVDPVRVTHVWRGDVGFTALHTDVDGDSFKISLYAVPMAPCAELLVRMTGVDRDPGLMSATTASGGALTMPVGLPSAVGACSQVTNTIEFSFLLKT